MLIVEYNISTFTFTGLLVMRLFSALIASLLISATAYADQINGRVVGVLDGDTIDVIDASNHQYRIRFAGIDAPEKSQAFGQVSKKSLSNMVYNQVVTIEYKETDRYGRVIGVVKANGTDINLEQVKAGLAWHYKQFQKNQSAQDRELYSNAEAQAKAGRIGLWADASPTPPWDYRHNQ